MRQPKRIPIIMNAISMKEFINDLDIFADKEEVDKLVKGFDMEQIQSYWESNPDLRLTQVLVNMDYIPNAPGSWYYIEERDWVIDEGYLKARDIMFWGQNFDENMKRLSETVWKPIAELNTEHIEAILDGKFTNNPVYLKVFAEELALRKMRYEQMPVCKICSLTTESVKRREEGDYICDDCLGDLDYINS